MLDSLTAVDALRRLRIRTFLDLGSGGGFPGIPLAVALPAGRTLLVDSIAKKARFLGVVAAAVGGDGSIRAEAARAELLAANAAHRGRWPAITVRAVAPLAELVELGLPLLGARGLLIAWKTAVVRESGALDAELAAARSALAAIDRDATMEVLTPIPDPVPASLADLAGHRLVIVERGRRAIASEWPRNPAARHREPWLPDASRRDRAG